MTNNNKSIAETISETLRDEILRGQYRPGERLPSERDLAVRFKSNRGAIREALKKLELLGIASINPGGVRVIAVEEASLSVLGPLVDLKDMPDPVLVCHLFEVLGALISMSARTAIERADDAEIVQMQTIVNRMICNQAATGDNQENWKELGTLFTEINNNLVLRLIINGLKTQFLNRLQQQQNVEFKIDETRSMQILKQLEAGLCRRDSRGVSDAINNHFLLVTQTLNDIFNTSDDQTRSLAK